MLEGFKRRLQAKIENNAVKVPNISWKKANGEVVKEDIIIKRSKIPLIGDWSRVYPPIDEDGKFKWFNIIFGGYKNFIKLALVMGILYMIYSWVTGILGVYAEYFNGNDYIIIAKETFNKFCTKAIYDTADISQVGNLNISVFK